MTDDELDAIELRLRMATPGPWKAPAYRYSPEASPSTNSVTSENANICGLHDGGQTRERIDANAHFIANAPTDVASLVASLRDTRTALRQLQDAIRYIAAPTVGYPGSAIDAPEDDLLRFVVNSASEMNVRSALVTCIRQARAVLVSDAPTPAATKEG